MMSASSPATVTNVMKASGFFLNANELFRSIYPYQTQPALPDMVRRYLKPRNISQKKRNKFNRIQSISNAILQV